MENRLFLTAAACLFALVEFALLIIACIAQFEPGFSTEEAIGCIGTAFISAAIATLFCGLAIFTTSRRNPLAVRLVIVVWSGFTLLIIFGLVLNEFAVAREGTARAGDVCEVDPETRSDVIGTWQIREIAPANHMEEPAFASYQRFRMELKSDGTMVARHVPENIDRKSVV